MRDFQVLFEHGEHAELLDQAYAPYGRLGFPAPPDDRPWIYANFVQTLDGLVSLLGPHASGADIAQSPEDRWLMDLLRAHADAVVLGIRTLIQETVLGRPRPRGPVFRIMEPALQQLRQKLQRGPERNIFVTASTKLELDDYAVFDGDKVEPIILTTEEGAAALRPQLETHPRVRVMAAGKGTVVDLPLAMQRLREEFGIRRLLCEGGPTLYANLLWQGLIDEKFLTVSPVEAGQAVPEEYRTKGGTNLRPTIMPGPGFTREFLPSWQWVSCRKIEDYQFNRYRLRRS